MTPNNWHYLGDGVYARPDQFGIWLHTNDHKNPTDRIYLEWTVFMDLKRLVSQIAQQRKEEKNGNT